MLGHFNKTQFLTRATVPIAFIMICTLICWNFNHFSTRHYLIYNGKITDCSQIKMRTFSEAVKLSNSRYCFESHSEIMDH